MKYIIFVLVLFLLGCSNKRLSDSQTESEQAALWCLGACSIVRSDTTQLKDHVDNDNKESIVDKAPGNVLPRFVDKED